MIHKALNASVQLALWPASVAHELTHLAAGYVWTEQVSGYDVHPLRPNWIALDISEAAPGWAVAITAVAPSLVGIAFAASVLVLLTVGGGSFPDAANEPGRWLLISAWWFVYTSPSGDDLAALRGQIAGKGHD